MSAFSWPYGCPEIENNFEYFKTQTAFSFFKGFGLVELKTLYEEALEDEDETVWIPQPRPKMGKIGLSTWYVKALLENINYENQITE